MGILWIVLAFGIGLYAGFLIRSLLARMQSYTGIMHIYEGEEKTVYSLELNEYPETIRFKKEVVFKVDAPEEFLHRD